MRIAVTVQTPASAQDVLIRCEDDASAASVAQALGATVGVPEGRLGVPERDGLTPAGDDSDTLAGSGLLYGQRIGLDSAPPATPAPPPSGLQLHIVSGPAAGGAFTLPPGEHEIGRGAQISWPDPLLSRRHALLSVTADGMAVTDLGSSNGTFLDGDRVSADPVPVTADAVLRIGSCLLQIRAAHAADAHLAPGAPGWLDFVRPPRITATQAAPEIVVPTAPTAPPRRRIPWPTMLAPLLLGVVMFAVMRSPMYLLMVLVSPLMMLFNFICDRRLGVADHKQALADYAARLAEADQSLARAVAGEARRLREQLPDAAATYLTCLLPDHRLWERRRADPDALAIRLGSGTVLSAVKVTGAAAPDERWLPDVPLGVRLSEHPIVGVAGPAVDTAGVLRWIVAQLCAYHATRDLSCSFLTAELDPDWAWLQWLPHLRPDDDQIARVIAGAQPLTAHVAWLNALVASRRGPGNSRPDPRAFPAHIVVIDGYRQIRDTPGLTALLDDGPSVGVYVVCADRLERYLPEQCSATLLMSTDEQGRARLLRRGEPAIERLLVDQVGVAWCDTLARELAPLIDAGADSGDAGLPASSRLLDVLGLPDPGCADLVRRWAAGGRTTQAVIGETGSGVFQLDIRADGPHGLVAGTTGSGKSELLQTIIASLAVGNRPDEMTFVLVDYKGGAAFKDCTLLPHTVGMVTDLDGHLTSRALESLAAELRRREHQLARAGAKDIEDYLDAKAPGDEPMPRLLIVIDEFAALVQELPDFVEGLIDIARRGRSLGVHLILATQRPAGVVSAEIKSNTNLRIALRVTDPADSADVIDAPDAAAISKSTPGRAIARLGHSSLIGFQSSRVGGRAPGAASQDISVWAYRPDQIGGAIPQPETSDDGATMPTDLARLVEAARQASVTTGIAAPPPPWLPPLDDVVTLDGVLADFPDAVRPEQLVVPIGLSDVPSEQRRSPAVLDIAHMGHLAVLGAARSGRSTALRAIAGAIGRFVSPADVHMYGIDCGNNALLPLMQLPHVGAVITRDQSERMARFVTRLQRLIADRQQTLAQAGFADITEQRAYARPGQELPYILILFDRWESFTQVYESIDGGQLIDAWTHIVQEGHAAGVRVVVTGDRSLLLGRVGALFPDKALLKLTDDSDYSVIGMNSRQVPSTMVPGRCFWSDGVRETQFLLLDDDPSGTAQATALLGIATQAKQRWAGLPAATQPFRVDILPTRFTLDQMDALPHEQLAPEELPIAVAGDTLSLRAFHAINHGPGLLVAGPRQSGRSTVLRTFAFFAALEHWRIAVVTPRISPLRTLTGEAIVGQIGMDADPGEVAQLLADLRAGSSPSLVLVDDIELLASCAWLSDLLEQHLGQLRDTGHLLVGAGTSNAVRLAYAGLVPALKASRSGVLLSPDAGDQELFGITLPRSALGTQLPAGGGFVVRAGQFERAQVIWPQFEEQA